MQPFLVDALDGFHRVPGRTRFDLIASDIEPDVTFRPADFLNRIGREQDVLARPPVTRGDDEIADVPVDVVGQKNSQHDRYRQPRPRSIRLQ